MKNLKQYTAENTKLFSYAGSKAKYQAKFNNLHSQVGVKQVNTYIEAFGGTLASMFHNLQNIQAQRIIVNDINPRLVNMYRQIKDNPQEVIEVFTLFEDTFQSHIPQRFKGKGFVRNQAEREKYLAHLRDFYKEVQTFYNHSDFYTPQNAGALIFLLQHNYNGVYTEAKKTGYFNITFNWNMKNICLEKITKNLKNLHSFFTENNVVIENLDTEALIQKYSDTYDTMIYLDPPYINSEVGYSAEQTTDYNKVEAHLELLESCKIFDYVLYSNNFNKTINSQFKQSVEFNRTNGISQNKQNKSKREFLGFIDNTYQIMPTVEFLLEELELNALKNTPNVETLLNVNNISTTCPPHFSYEKNIERKVA